MMVLLLFFTVQPCALKNSVKQTVKHLIVLFVTVFDLLILGLTLKRSPLLLLAVTMVTGLVVQIAEMVTFIFSKTNCIDSPKSEEEFPRIGKTHHVTRPHNDLHLLKNYVAVSEFVFKN